MTRYLLTAAFALVFFMACSDDRTQIRYIESDCHDSAPESDGYVEPRDLDVVPDDASEDSRLAPWRPDTDSAIERPEEGDDEGQGFGV